MLFHLSPSQNQSTIDFFTLLCVRSQQTVGVPWILSYLTAVEIKDASGRSLTRTAVVTRVIFKANEALSLQLVLSRGSAHFAIVASDSSLLPIFLVEFHCQSLFCF